MAGCAVYNIRIQDTTLRNSYSFSSSVLEFASLLSAMTITNTRTSVRRHPKVRLYWPPDLWSDDLKSEITIIIIIIIIIKSETESRSGLWGFHLSILDSWHWTPGPPRGSQQNDEQVIKSHVRFKNQDAWNFYVLEKQSSQQNRNEKCRFFWHQAQHAQLSLTYSRLKRDNLWQFLVHSRGGLFTASCYEWCTI